MKAQHFNLWPETGFHEVLIVFPSLFTKIVGCILKQATDTSSSIKLPYQILLKGIQPLEMMEGGREEDRLDR
jgi:hypothetical protein